MSQLRGASGPRSWRRALAAAATAVLTVGTAGAALADDISNNLDTSVDAVAEVMALNVGGTSRSTTLRVVTTNGDGKSGCNLTGQTSLSLSVSSGDTGVATVSPSSVTFTGCGDTKVLTVTPVAQGSATITVSQTFNDTGATFDLAPATFVANVAAPSNTAPGVAVTGVTSGAEYPKGSVPSAGCEVADPEDGSSSFAATLGAVTGPYGGDGIGSQTASCSYTDGGGLTASSSVTYLVVDPSAPVITSVLSPPSPDGTNGWYRGDVALDWTVDETDSPSSLTLGGCADTTVTADQPATDYTCSASSAGGSAGPQTVTIRRDGTAPGVTAGTVTGTLGDNGWYTSDVSVDFTATDDLSGPATQVQSASSSGQGDSVVVSSPAFTDTAGNTAAAGAAIATVKVDTGAPNPPTVSLDPEPNSAGWNNAPVTVTFDPAGDNGPSGVEHCGPAAVVTAETSGDTVSGTCVDEAGNESAATSVVVRLDGTGPLVTLAAVRGTQGTEGWYTSPVEVDFTATDQLSGVSGAHTRTVTSSAEGADVRVDSPAFTDVAGNTTPTGAAYGTFKIDTQPPNAPVVSLSSAANAAGWHHTPVTVHFEPAGDNGPSGGVTCTPDVVVSAETADTGQVVLGSCTDAAGNLSADASVTVRLDMTAPVVSHDADADVVAGSVGTNGWYTSDVTVRFTATDALSGLAPGASPQDAVSSGEGSAVHVASPAFADLAGNASTPGAVGAGPFKVDKTHPSAPTFSGGPAAGGSYVFGTLPAAPTCSATDTGSGLASCDVTGYSAAVGSHTLTATATDHAGLSSSSSLAYTVTAWTLKGFYAPVDTLGVVNTVKAGSTVPLKFEVFAGATELTATDVVRMSATKSTCAAGAVEDVIELVTAGATSLRYDTVGGQYVYNWQTPKSGAGTCWTVTATTDDGSTTRAVFKLK